MYFSWASGLLISGVALFMVYAVILMLFNNRIAKPDRNHFRNSFPYNFYQTFPISSRVLLYILLILSTALMVVGECFYFLSFQSSFQTILAITFSLSFLCLVSANLIPLSSYKAHIVFSAVGFFFYILSAVCYSFVTVLPGAVSATTASYVSLPIVIIIGVLGFGSIFLIVNPKLKNWAKMDKTEENGTTYYVKPKVNFYAMDEWIFLFEEVLTALLLFFDILATQALTFE